MNEPLLERNRQLEQAVKRVALDIVLSLRKSGNELR